jgi:hypothetical protein
MTTIYQSNFIWIKKIDDNSYSFTIDKNTSSNMFLASLDIASFIVNDTETEKNKTYILKLSSVQTLPQLLAHTENVLSYQDCLSLTRTLGNQMTFLERNKKTIVSFDMTNIIVINNDVFLYMDFDGVYDIQDDNTILIDTPLKPTIFFSPEARSITTLPSVIHKNTWNYSLALIVGFSLTNNPFIYTHHTMETHKSTLEMIEDTSLYFCLLRCLHKKPEKRMFLFI